MPAPAQFNPWLPALLALAVLAGTHEAWMPGPETALARGDGQEQPAGLLPGTWLREQEGEGVRARRILHLAADGGFQESVRVTDASGKVTEQLHQGTWLYDGTNLKRKYTLMNGQPPSRLNLPFATFQIEFPSRNEFVGVDHIHGNRIAYRRVDAQTRP